MEALSQESLPSGSGWQYEPKWDGFRCIVFRDGTKIFLQSKNGQPLARYFPELVAVIAQIKAPKFVLDGEIVVPSGGDISFDALLQRIHPAESRIRRLAQETPATLIVFDLLADEAGRPLIDLPLSDRRTRLERFAKKFLKSTQMKLSPQTRDYKEAVRWLARVGGALDGVVAKRLDLPYQSGNRLGMVKVKRLRTVDCVVGGFRYAQKQRVLGSLLLGLYDDAGLLHHVGFTSSFTDAQRRELLAKVEKLKGESAFTGSAPGMPSRWANERSTEWEPLKPKLVVEVRYDHFSGDRFRHGTKLMRWRPDKDPGACTFAQLEQHASPLVQQVLA